MLLPVRHGDVLSSLDKCFYSDHVTIQTILALTSKGYVAVFLEHNDGSGSSCMLPDGSITEYIFPPNTKDFTAPENREFRYVEMFYVQKKS